MKRVYWVEWMDGYKQYFGTNYNAAIETQAELHKYGILSKFITKEVEEAEVNELYTKKS